MTMAARQASLSIINTWSSLRLTSIESVMPSSHLILCRPRSFSALDFATDAALRAALHENLRDLSLLIVASRIATIRHADSIIVLDEGRAVGSGTHEELMETCQTYQEIVQSQFTVEEVGQ